MEEGSDYGRGCGECFGVVIVVFFVSYYFMIRCVINLCCCGMLLCIVYLCRVCFNVIWIYCICRYVNGVCCSGEVIGREYLFE